MNFERHYHQDATYWAPSGENAEGGSTFSAPKQIRVRWEDISQEFTNEKGELAVSQSIVYSPIPIVQDGYLALGKYTAANPRDVAVAHEVKTAKNIPDLRNAATQHVAIL